jgi:tRNA pseudouridine38-40 synthase
LRYFIEFAYKGSNYHGWQYQPNASSVQETLTQALSLMLREPIELTGAGRTDTGVHARQMFAHFDSEVPIVFPDLIKKLNAYLPKDIAVWDFYTVAPDAHARFDATKRTYEYHIHRRKDAFECHNSWLFTHSLDIDQMNDACKLLLNHTDFECFSKLHTDVKTFFCKLTHAEWTSHSDRWIFTISADRFLRNMVRAIVGTLIDVGTGKTSLTDLEQILASKNRSKAGFSVPAHGLYLTEVHYPYIPFRAR